MSYSHVNGECTAQKKIVHNTIKVLKHLCVEQSKWMKKNMNAKERKPRHIAVCMKIKMFRVF